MASRPVRTLDLAEAAAFLKVHPQTVCRLAREGALSAAKVGRMEVRLSRRTTRENEPIIPGV